GIPKFCNQLQPYSSGNSFTFSSLSLLLNLLFCLSERWMVASLYHCHVINFWFGAIVGELKPRRDDLSKRVEREEDKGLQRLAQRVETIESQVNDMFSVRTTELQSCLCGFCSKSLTLSYRYGKRVFMMLKEVENPKANGGGGGFDVLAEKAHQQYGTFSRKMKLWCLRGFKDQKHSRRGREETRVLTDKTGTGKIKSKRRVTYIMS
ncbi:hypothetical protein HID58_085421, partial [Brassica napus]